MRPRAITKNVPELRLQGYRNNNRAAMLHYRPSYKRAARTILHEATTLPIRPIAGSFLSARPLQNARLYSSGGEAAPIVKKERRHRPDRPRTATTNNTEPPGQRFKIDRRKNDGTQGSEVTPRKVFSIKFTDPLQLAESTLGKLKREKFDEALELVRKNSASLECTVPWNHLIDYLCKKSKMNHAIKTYNEMKKRGQVPDGHTYTIIFRGLAASAQTHPTAVKNALSIYHSMDSPSSPVAPNPIHTNAVLTVCAKADDLDAMFGVASKLKERGVRAPNSLTYTIMFNAMRSYMRKSSEKLNADEFQPTRAKMVLDARRMWQDIVRRWRHGDMWIDEELVCAMGRILMLGGPGDKNDIPALLRQTMKLPQLLMRNEREIAARSAPALPEPSFDAWHDERIEDDLPEVPTMKEGLEEWENIPASLRPAVPTTPRTPVLVDQFQPITPPRRTDTREKGLSAFATPGRNTLDLLLDAFPEPKFSVAAMMYWKILTSIYGVEPDTANYHGYLRILRMSRQSGEAARVVKEMGEKPEMLEHGTFRIAMAACVRDKTNPNSFKNAEKIIDVLIKRGGEPDIAMLHSYLDVALDTSADIDAERFRVAPKMVIRPQVVEGMKRALSECGLENMHFYLKKLTEAQAPTTEEVKEETPEVKRDEKAKKAKRIMGALEKCESAVEVQNEKMAKRGVDSEKKALVLKLVQRMISAYDQLMDKGLAPRDKFRELHEKRSKLAAMVTVESNKYIPDAWNRMKNASFKTWKKMGGEASQGMRTYAVDEAAVEKEVQALQEAARKAEEKW